MPDILSTDIDTEEDFIEAEAKLHYLQRSTNQLKEYDFAPIA